MDGQVGAIRDALDDAGHTDVAILAYAAKYASRRSTGRSATRSTCAIAVAVTARATRWTGATPARRSPRSTLDIAEGADMVMVKPALAYLDVIAERPRRVRRAGRRVPRERRVRDDQGRRRSWAGSTATPSPSSTSPRSSAPVPTSMLTYFTRWFAESVASGATHDDDPYCDPESCSARWMHADGLHRCRGAVEHDAVRAVPAGDPRRCELLDPRVQGGGRRAVRRRSGRGSRRLPMSRARPISTSCRATAPSSSATPIRRSRRPSRQPSRTSGTKRKT